jgi:hypothetical protein
VTDGDKTSTPGPAADDTVAFRDLPEGTVVRLRDGSAAEVTANPRDGAWLFVRIVESGPGTAQVGAEEMVFCTDVIGWPGARAGAV